MNSNEQYFRRTVGAIGVSLLLMLVLLQLFQIGIWACWMILPTALLSSELGDIVYELCYAVVYLACFLLPGWVLYRRMKRGGLVYRPLQTEVRFSPLWLLAIPACIAIIFSASYCNAMLTDIFSPFGINEATMPASGITSAPYEIVLRFLTVCLIPGFCEEFLFRGLILENCLPFGRAKAIFISSFLFALMHQNPEQIFYAFVAGIVFGLIYERTRSIWLVILIHVFNNFVSMIEEFIPDRMPNDIWLAVIVWALEIVLFLLGMLAIVILIRRTPAPKTDFSDGIFGRSVAQLDAVPAFPIEDRRTVKLFLHPTMLCFLAFCAVQVVAALLWNGVM